MVEIYKCLKYKSIVLRNFKFNLNKMNYKILLLRHGESQWNLENRFTGWVDVDLTKKGQIEAREAGLLLKESQFKFDLVYSLEIFLNSLLRQSCINMKVFQISFPLIIYIK